MCKRLDDTSQQVYTGIAGESILPTGVILLIDNIDKDKRLNYSRQS
jgi:hypothetical protein